MHLKRFWLLLVNMMVYFKYSTSKTLPEQSSSIYKMIKFHLHFLVSSLTFQKYAIKQPRMLLALAFRIFTMLLLKKMKFFKQSIFSSNLLVINKKGTSSHIVCTLEINSRYFRSVEKELRAGNLQHFPPGAHRHVRVILCSC